MAALMTRLYQWHLQCVSAVFLLPGQLRLVAVTKTGGPSRVGLGSLHVSFFFFSYLFEVPGLLGGTEGKYSWFIHISCQDCAINVWPFFLILPFFLFEVVHCFA